MSEDIRFAVLIDAENISPKYIQVIFDEVSNYGVSTYRRIYGDWTSTRNNRWKEVLLDNSITPIQQYSYTEGKNASDSAMIIDAMDILYTLSVDGFVLVSSDSDFTRLASRLRESGMNVIGMGESKTPNAFISACNTFKYLDILYATLTATEEEEKEEKALPGKTSPARRSRSANGGNGKNKNGDAHSTPHSVPLSRPQTTIGTVRKALRSIVRENSDEENWISLANLGNQLSKRFPDFDVRNYGHQKLVTFIESFHEFEVARRSASELSNKQLFVRLKEK